MDKIKYIMVTNWDGHWDKFKSPVPGVQSTLFTQSMIKDPALAKGPWERKVPTLFIKKDRHNNFERAWRGIADNFAPDIYKDQPAVRFEVLLQEEVVCPLDIQSHRVGWHLNKTGFPLATVAETGLLRPPFFSKMQNCSWNDFEQYCFYLLRSIGINDLHTIAQQSQKGQADGFFDLPYLSVI
ncbi:hypothetical protein [Chitinophaga parva]|nr:hypothetical protein [Chitinophaga parva]